MYIYIKTKMVNIVLTEKQLETITNELKVNDEEVITEAKWYNLVGDVLGIVDPTGIVDVVNGISYFSQGDHLFGLLSIISAIPIAGDAVAKPVMGALKIGGAATKELNVAMKLAKAGKTAEAGAALAKLSKDPGVVGKFLQSARVWAPKVAAKIEKLPGGVLKGFKNTIIDYLKLLQNAGSKSARFQKRVGNLAKNMGNAVKPVENIKSLQNFLKTEKVAVGLAKKGPLANVFLGGAPRLFGNRRMRILMRQTKWWLGFLDYINVGNFVGPDELASKMSEDEIVRKMDEYNKTSNAKKYAEEDFGSQSMDQGEISKQEIDDFIASRRQGSTPQTNSPSGGDFLSNFMGNVFGGQILKTIV
jgi:hypothetical protein